MYTRHFDSIVQFLYFTEILNTRIYGYCSCNLVESTFPCFFFNILNLACVKRVSRPFLISFTLKGFYSFILAAKYLPIIPGIITHLWGLFITRWYASCNSRRQRKQPRKPPNKNAWWTPLSLLEVPSTVITKQCNNIKHSLLNHRNLYVIVCCVLQ